MFKVNNRGTRTRSAIRSKLTIKTPERCQGRRSGVFIVNFEHTAHLALVFLSLILSRLVSNSEAVAQRFQQNFHEKTCGQVSLLI